jgi:hypothetical protein
VVDEAKKFFFKGLSKAWNPSANELRLIARFLKTEVQSAQIFHRSAIRGTEFHSSEYDEKGYSCSHAIILDDAFIKESQYAVIKGFLLCSTQNGSQAVVLVQCFKKTDVKSDYLVCVKYPTPAEPVHVLPLEAIYARAIYIDFKAIIGAEYVVIPSHLK